MPTVIWQWSSINSWNLYLHSQCFHQVYRQPQDTNSGKYQSLFLLILISKYTSRQQIMATSQPQQISGQLTRWKCCSWITAHWIESKGPWHWLMCNEVISFKAIAGVHTGENLGWYFVVLCKWAGIIDHAGTKVSILTFLLYLCWHSLLSTAFLHDSRQHKQQW